MIDGSRDAAGNRLLSGGSPGRGATHRLLVVYSCALVSLGGIPALPVPSISVRLIFFAHSFHNQPDTVPEALIISKASIFNRQIILGGYRPVNSLKLFIPEAFVFDLLLHFVGICFRFYVPAVGFCACIMSVSMLCSHKNSNNCSMSLKPFLYNSPSGSLLSLPPKRFYHHACADTESFCENIGHFKRNQIKVIVH